MKRARISRVTSHKRQRAARAVALICGGTSDYLSFPLRRVVSASMRLSRAHLRRIVPRPLAAMGVSPLRFFTEHPSDTASIHRSRSPRCACAHAFRGAVRVRPP